jgi:hypothetical protein
LEIMQEFKKKNSIYSIRLSLNHHDLVRENYGSKTKTLKLEN